MIIEKKDWQFCKICNCELVKMIKEHGGNGIYKSQCFKKHIEKYHKLSLTSYFGLGPKCPCGICNKNLTVIIDSSNIRYKKFECGFNDGVKKWSEEAKIKRCGVNNPMFNKTPWNKGLTKENNNTLKSISKKMSKRIVSEKTKNKQKESAIKRTVHGHTGHKHSLETKEALRLNTLNMIRSGKFKQTNTKPFIAMERILNELNIVYEKEKICGIWSFDFYLSDLNIYLEVDGDYFHSNPLIYKNGPKTKTQKINFYRDTKKNKFCKDNNLSLIRIWESEIFGDEKCVKQRLLALKK
jgi:hypothetical protein